jgi:hypothetical protein
VIIGIVGGTASEPRVGYLDHPQPVTDELLALAGSVTPTEVFRFAATCQCSRCPQFSDEKCQIGARMVKFLPEAVDRLPPCTIRPNCRWWQQEGKAACLRCPVVVTDNYNPSDQMLQVADISST